MAYIADDKVWGDVSCCYTVTPRISAGMNKPDYPNAQVFIVAQRGAVGRGTVLQAGKSRFLLPMEF